MSTIKEHEQRDSTEPRALDALWHNLYSPAARCISRRFLEQLAELVRCVSELCASFESQ